MMNPQYVEAVAEEARAALGRRSLRASDLARALNVSPATAGRLLSGDSPLNVDQAFTISEMTGIPVGQLLDPLPLASGSAA